MAKTENLIWTKELGLILDRNIVLEKINIEVNAGEMVGIIGPNGAGKTTLLRLILGLIKPTWGAIKVFESDPRSMGKKRENVGYMPQRPLVSPNFPVSVLDVVTMGLISSATLGKPLTCSLRQRAQESLEKVGLISLQGRSFFQLSGGQQQKVFLARALCKSPRLLLLDEPNAGLDLPTRNRFMAFLNELQKEHGLTIVIVSHDLAAVASYADYLFCINRIMHVHGNPSEVINSPYLAEAYRCEFELLFNKGGS